MLRLDRMVFFVGGGEKMEKMENWNWRGAAAGKGLIRKFSECSSPGNSSRALAIRRLCQSAIVERRKINKTMQRCKRNKSSHKNNVTTIMTIRNGYLINRIPCPFSPFNATRNPARRAILPK